MKNLTFLFCFLALFSCAKTDEQLVDSAKQEAKSLLTKGECADAKKVLDEVGFQSDDAEYITLYSSCYGCMANYSELDLFADISVIDSAQMLGSLTMLSTSNETQADSDNYKNIMLAIDTLLNAGATSQPSAAARTSFFGPRGGTDLSFQALYLILVELGKFMGHYGNAAGGVKGAGALGNTCIFSYTQSDATTFIGDTTPGSCATTGGGEGSDDLDNPPVATAVIKARLCEGIYLFNNLRDILANVTVSDNSSFGELGEISAIVETAVNAADNLEGTSYNNFHPNSINMIKSVTSKSDCESLDLGRLEKWYAIVFETLF